MGPSARWAVFVLCWCLAAASPASHQPQVEEREETICDREECTCEPYYEHFVSVNCTFKNGQIIDLYPGMLSNQMIKVAVIDGGADIVLHPQLFTVLHHFNTLLVDNCRSLLVKKNAFLNLSSPSSFVDVGSCKKVVVQTGAFKNVQGPVHFRVRNSEYVMIENSPFGWIGQAEFNNVNLLELAEGAFTSEARAIGKHGPTAKIILNSVNMKAIPKNAFRSSFALIELNNSDIREVRPEAFSANTLSSVKMVNSTVRKMQHDAFSERTLIESLKITGCVLNRLESGAIRSGVANLSIKNSLIEEVETGALVVTVAHATIQNNHFGRLHPRSFAFNNWNYLYVEDNTFKEIANASMEMSCSTQRKNFSFVRNTAQLLQAGGLAFVAELSQDEELEFVFESNYFGHTCTCDIEKWLEETLGSGGEFAKNSYCVVDTLLGKCWSLDEGYLTAAKYLETICRNGGIIKCNALPTKDSDSEKTFSDAYHKRSNAILHLVLGLSLLIAVVATIFILLIQGGVWLKRKGYCSKFQQHHQQSRYTNEDGSTEAEDIMVTVEKIPEETTLPDELTQELLQALREKLENPLTYNDAREMIERLYEHFIIEDSYTNNNRQDNENLYEELANIQQPPKQLQPPPTEDNGIPARTFSFLRLIEERFNLVPTEPAPPQGTLLVNDYSEPSDAEVHLYSEIPKKSVEGQQNELNETRNREKLQQIQNGTATTKSNGSANMAFRPLPEKPRSADPGEGPSRND